MNRFEMMIKKDIDFCDGLIKENYATENDVNQLIGKYVLDYPIFKDEIRKYIHVSYVDVVMLYSSLIVNALKN